ncbi:hypothetical protein [Shewanella algae]|uniref:hypothetical protein n=1 Tax=Shewanella algae TaxID=38313 RepID=UPI0011830EAE|nr:hypothetical protein [Shewanella algae]TVL52121.1 hypothetical protein AYI98_04810 [Shewanella algae]
MARIGNLFIAGAEDLGGIYKCGVSYALSKKPPSSFLYTTRQGDWQVEFTTESTDVVARSANEISYNAVQSRGFSAIQEALDVLSVKGILSASLADPARSSICVYRRSGKTVLAVYSLFDFPMGVNVEVTQIDASGNEVKPPPPQEPMWNESFRYYRLSQCSSDLFDAYRNLFLAFEALLNSICQKKRSEGESAWLRRALSVVAAKTSLAQSTPTGNEDPVSYIINSQYKNVRCKLQHAKFPNAQLPHDQATPQEVKQAYSELVRIWRQIAGEYFGVPTGGGVITYIGFSKMMEGAFQSGVSIHYTPDMSPPARNDTKVSPKGLPSHEFSLSEYVGQAKPGVVRILGKENVLNGSERHKSPVHRICTATSSTLFGVAFIESGLTVVGVDEWEYIHDLRLINSSQPRVEFKT